MTKRKSKKSQQPTTLGYILGFIVLVVGFIISQFSPNTTLIDQPPVTPSVGAPVTTAPISGQPLAAVPLVAPSIAQSADGVTTYTMPRAVGANRGFWQVYFTMPDGTNNAANFTGGLDHILAAQIETALISLDIAAYEFNSPVLTNAVIRAHQRGLTVRMVTDTSDGLEDEDSTIPQLIAAGIPVVDDQRSALMHNKFIIVDRTHVWTGSWNYTINDTYRNNNSALVLRSRNAVNNYLTEFNEMFQNRQFGARSPADTPNPVFTQDGIVVSTYFSPEDDLIRDLIEVLDNSTRSIRFMAFSYTQEDLGAIMLEQASEGVRVQGVFERVGSLTQYSQMTPLFCAGLDVRSDGNPYIFHHKVMIIDDTTVAVGSFNFSLNAVQSNDENLVIISDPLLAAQFNAEFDRRFAQSNAVTDIACN